MQIGDKAKINFKVVNADYDNPDRISESMLSDILRFDSKYKGNHEVTELKDKSTNENYIVLNNEMYFSDKELIFENN